MDEFFLSMIKYTDLNTKASFMLNGETLEIFP